MITDSDMDKTKFNNGINVRTCINCDSIWQYSIVSFSFRLSPNFIPIISWSGKLTQSRRSFSSSWYFCIEFVAQVCCYRELNTSSLLFWKLTPLVSSPVFPCLPLINMCKGRVNDVTHCFILEKKVPSCILIKCLPPYIMKWIGLLMSVTLLHIGTIGLPRLARDLLTLIG